MAELAFNQLVYTAIEDNGLMQQPLLIQLSLSILSSFDITIQVNTDSFNATTGGPTGEAPSARSFKIAWFTGRDYTPGPFDVTFPANKINATFDVEIEPDNLLEGNEVFILRIVSPSSLRDIVTAGDVATVVIIDNDRKNVHIILNSF